MRFVKNVIAFIKLMIEEDAAGNAAKTAFFFLLALFPLTMLAAVALGYFGMTIAILEGFLPGELIDMFGEVEIISPASSPFAFIGAVWAASAGVWALMQGVSMAYTGKRLSSAKARLLAIAFTLGFVIVLPLTLVMLATLRGYTLAAVAAVIFLLIFSLYSFTPGTSAHPRRAAWTSAAATSGWLAVSFFFAMYLRLFSGFGALYGSLGAFLGVCLWVFCISIVIILGAELGAFKPDKS